MEITGKTMKLAIQEMLLPGSTTQARLEIAKKAGFEGIEFDAEGLGERIPEILDTLDQTGLEAAAVNLGGTHILHPEFVQREASIVRMRLAMANALDIGAKGVVFGAHRADTPRLPDLHPYKSDIELEAELLVSQLRATLCDFAYAIGAELYLQVSNAQETHLILSMERATIVLAKNDNHPHLKVAANTCDLAVQEDNPVGVLRQHMAQLAYLYFSDTGRSLPGMGSLPFAKYLDVLKESAYEGWITITTTTMPHQDALSETATMLKNLVK